MNDSKRFMDEKGRVKVWAAKREMKYPTRNGDYLLLTGIKTCHLQKYIEEKI